MIKKRKINRELYHLSEHLDNAKRANTLAEKNLHISLARNMVLKALERENEARREGER